MSVPPLATHQDVVANLQLALLEEIKSAALTAAMVSVAVTQILDAIGMVEVAAVAVVVVGIAGIHFGGIAGTPFSGDQEVERAKVAIGSLQAAKVAIGSLQVAKVALESLQVVKVARGSQPAAKAKEA